MFTSEIDLPSRTTIKQLLTAMTTSLQDFQPLLKIFVNHLRLRQYQWSLNFKPYETNGTVFLSSSHLSDSILTNSFLCIVTIFFMKLFRPVDCYDSLSCNYLIKVAVYSYSDIHTHTHTYTLICI